MEITNTPHDRLISVQQAVRLERGRKPPIPDLIVLSQNKDPFNAGTEGHRASAEWFAEVFGQSTGAHLRRLHYRLVARGNTMRADGKLYENNQNSWDYLNAASRYARYLGLVDPEDIVDRRNPSPNIYMPPGWGTGPEWSYELETNQLDRISTLLGTSYLSPVEVETEVTGYLYEEALQPYHVEDNHERHSRTAVLFVGR
jgi:hypothetical protein